MVYEEGLNKYFGGTRHHATWIPGRCFMGKKAEVDKRDFSA